METTINIHKNIMKMLDKGTETTRKSRTFIIKSLMQRMMSDNQKMLKSYSRIKYQRRDEKENWQQLHLILNEYEYEYYLDMRKLFKMSVSFILAYAVVRYLDEVMNELTNRNIDTDNYTYRNYIFVRKTIDNIICWHLYWGIPEKLTDW